MPVIATGHAPPAPVGLTVTTDANNFVLADGAKEYASILYLNITASSCRNPAILEGTLVRPGITTAGERYGSGGASPPKQALVTIFGSLVKAFAIGLTAPGGPIYTMRHGRPIIWNPRPKARAFPVQSLPLVREDGATTAVLDAPRWPDSDSSDLIFRANVDLVRANGFGSCYIALPEVLHDEEVEQDETPYERAWELNLRASQRIPPLTEREWPDAEDIGAAEIRVSVTGSVVESSSVSRDGKVAPDGSVRYTCYPNDGKVKQKPDLEQGTQRLLEPEEPNCASAPVFQAVNAVGGSNLHIIIAGILGALAVSILYETSFLAETGQTKSVKGNK
jgi:hypothetical protein